jgi:glutathione S-transferase
MRLLWSSRSPFVRKVMVAAHEMGVAGRIATERVAVSGRPRLDAWHGAFAERPSMRATRYADVY